ncbi:response regulator [Polaromonas sp. YR568]|uniref:ATP-binding response regulator n=1 Tax=Polaromonas sp. YR568 TaxID=1855301 RepID=UPI00398BEA54
MDAKPGKTDRILVVDNDRDVLLLLQVMLRAEGYENIVALQDAREVCANYRASPAALILLDLHMPYLSGYEVMTQLRELGDPLLAPVLVLTGDTDSESLLKSFAGGSQDFIAKPFSQAELAARVASLLAVQRGRRATYAQAELLQETVMLRTKELRDMNLQLQAKVEKLHLADAAMREVREDLRALVGRQETLREDERKRIAREIHDELGSLLTGIKACLSVMGEGRADGTRSQAQLLGDATGLADTAVDTVRRVIADLRPSVLDHLGLWPGLEWYAGQWSQRTGVHCGLEVDEDACNEDISPERSTMLFRIVQEALTNVARHAHASSVVIHAGMRQGDVRIEVSDNGKGVAPDRLLDRRSFGLLGMRERAHYFGGEFSMGPGKAGGTTVVVRCPPQAAP